MWEALKGPRGEQGRGGQRRDKVWRAFLGPGGDLFSLWESSLLHIVIKQNNTSYIYQTRSVDPEGLPHPHPGGGGRLTERGEPAPAPPCPPPTPRENGQSALHRYRVRKTGPGRPPEWGEGPRAPPAPPGGCEDGGSVRVSPVGSLTGHSRHTALSRRTCSRGPRARRQGPGRAPCERCSTRPGPGAAPSEAPQP